MLFTVPDAIPKRTSHSAAGQMCPSFDWQPCSDGEQMGLRPVEHLLVATDLTQRSDRAMQRAVQLAVDLGAQLNVLHVIKSGLPRRVAQHRMIEARSIIREQMHHLAASTDPDVTVNVRIGEPVMEILREAQELGSSAIIMGSEREARHDEHVFSNHTQARTIEHSQVPVLLVHGVPDGAYRRVTIDIDISPMSVIAMKAASRFAPVAQYQAVHFYPDEESAFQLKLGLGEPRALRFQRMQRFIGSVMGSVGSGMDLPGPIGLTIARGARTDALLRASRLARAELVIIGAGRKVVSRGFPHPSLDPRLLSSGLCDVLVVPAPIR